MRSAERVTIVDVARKAGVSVSTVSRVIRRHADVGPETRSRVQSAVNELGYRPSPIARALVSGQTRLLALLVADITNPFYPQIAKSIEDEAGKSGYTVVICNTSDQVAEVRRHLNRLLDQGLDGVIHASVGRDEANVLSALGDPRRVVFINRPPADPSVSYVVSDNYGGALELTRYLLDCGHRQIGFVGGPLFASNANERLRGFEAAMLEKEGTQAFVVHKEFGKESGSSAVRSWLEQGAHPTAIIANNDTEALGAMEELIRRGLRIPEDVAIAGFDGTDFSASPVIGLTTVDQHSDEMGRRAVRVLLKQLSTPKFTPTRQILPTQLLARRSTEPPTRSAAESAPRPAMDSIHPFIDPETNHTSLTP
jgi:LacI family transcriptional regulator, galactose operon repressor